MFINSRPNFLKEWRQFAHAVEKALKLGLAEQEVNFSFNMAHQTVVNENKNGDDYHRLSFCEFLEFLLRLHCQKVENLLAALPEDGNKDFSQLTDEAVELAKQSARELRYDQLDKETLERKLKKRLKK